MNPPLCIPLGCDGTDLHAMFALEAIALEVGESGRAFVNSVFNPAS